MTITEFLEARIAEDGAELSLADRGDPYSSEIFFEHVRAVSSYHVTPSRIRAECAAKRAIIAEAFDYGPNANWAADDRVLRHLAAVYADHPDYQQEWAL